MIVVKNLTIQAGSFSRSGLSFEVQLGEYAVVMGRTGCGKTTLLETLCGLRRSVAGTIEINGVDVTHAHPADRGIGYVPQDGALFPTMTVFDQISFPLQLRGVPVSTQRDRVEEMAEKLGISSLLSRYPRGLSGGEIQRVALARALVFRPEILMLDEPFSALDSPTREDLYDLVEQIRNQRPLSAFHITHNSNEAERLGDRTIRPLDPAD